LYTVYGKRLARLIEDNKFVTSSSTSTSIRSKVMHHQLLLLMAIINYGSSSVFAFFLVGAMPARLIPPTVALLVFHK